MLSPERRQLRWTDERGPVSWIYTTYLDVIEQRVQALNVRIEVRNPFLLACPENG